MPRRPAADPPAYREQIIALARARPTYKALAKEFEPSEQTIRSWILQAEADRGERPGVLTTDEREELSRLRRENRQLKVERDILPTAAGFRYLDVVLDVFSRRVVGWSMRDTLHTTVDGLAWRCLR